LIFRPVEYESESLEKDLSIPYKKSEKNRKVQNLRLVGIYTTIALKPVSD